MLTTTGVRSMIELTDFESWMAARQHKLLRTAYLLTGDVHVDVAPVVFKLG